MSEISPVLAEHSLDRLHAQAPELLQQVRSISVIDHATYLEVCSQKLAANDILKVIKKIKRIYRDALESKLIDLTRIEAQVTEAKTLAEQKRKGYKSAAEHAQEAAVTFEQAAMRLAAEQERLRDSQALTEAALVSGDTHLVDVAKRLLETPVDVPPVQMGPAVPKVKGIVDRKVWKVEVTDKKEVILTIAAALAACDIVDEPDILDAVDIKLSYFKDQAVEKRTAFSFPGIRAWQE